MRGSTFSGCVDILDAIIRSDRSCRRYRERIAQPLHSFYGEKTKKASYQHCGRSCHSLGAGVPLPHVMG